MKKISLILVILMVVGATLFAGGNSEKQQTEPGSVRGQGPVLQGASDGETEEVTITGTLVMKDGFLVLSVGNDLYSLGGAGTRFYMDDFEEGDVLEIEGLLMADCEGDCDRELDGHIFMERVVKDGEEYAFSPGKGEKGGRSSGRRSGRGNNRPMNGNGYRRSEV